MTTSKDSANEGELNFSLTREERPVTIDGKKYVLIEMDGKERDAYLNGVGQRIKHSPDGKPQGLKSFDGLQASLISSCLHTDTGARERVPITTVQAWPARVLTGLYEACRDLNGLDDEDVAPEGND